VPVALFAYAALPPNLAYGVYIEFGFIATQHIVQSLFAMLDDAGEVAARITATGTNVAE